MEHWHELLMAAVRLDQKSRAIVRSISETYIKAIAKDVGSWTTNIDAAKSQHKAYSNAVVANGVEVTTLDADQEHPNCVFVEDQAVVIDVHVLLPVTGHESRSGEHPPIADFL